MKITFLSPYPNNSGGIRVIGIHAKMLRDRGHTVSVICRRPNRGTRGERVTRFLSGLISKGHSAKSSHFDSLEVGHRIVNHDGPIREDDVPDGDAVIATFWITAEWMESFPESKGAKFYLVQHHEVHDHLPKERSMATYRLPYRKLCVSQWLQQVMNDEYGDSETLLIPNGIDMTHFSAPRRNKSIQEVSVGLMYARVPFKGTDIAMKAIKIAKSFLPGLKVLAFGHDPPEDVEHRELINEFVASPPQELIPKIYRSCDAWLFSSRSEGFGLPILEAMACRTPVIGTPAGAAPELIRRGGGILVEHENPSQMSQAIRTIAEMSNESWQQMSDAAYETAIASSWDATIDKLECALSAERIES